MGQVLVAVLVLAVLSGAAHAHYSVAEFLFAEQSQTSQHLDEEAFGDEFKRPAHSLERERYPGASSCPRIENRHGSTEPNGGGRRQK